MNRSRFTGAIICLGIALLLGVLYFTLPPDRLMFMVGDRNLAYVPSIVLGIVGVILLVSSFGVSETPEAEKREVVIDPDFLES